MHEHDDLEAFRKELIKIEPGEEENERSESILRIIGHKLPSGEEVLIDDVVGGLGNSDDFFSDSEMQNPMLLNRPSFNKPVFSPSAMSSMVLHGKKPDSMNPLLSTSKKSSSKGSKSKSKSKEESDGVDKDLVCLASSDSAEDQAKMDKKPSLAISSLSSRLPPGPPPKDVPSSKKSKSSRRSSKSKSKSKDEADTDIVDSKYAEYHLGSDEGLEAETEETKALPPVNAKTEEAKVLPPVNAKLSSLFPESLIPSVIVKSEEAESSTTSPKLTSLFPSPTEPVRALPNPMLAEPLSTVGPGLKSGLFKNKKVTSEVPDLLLEAPPPPRTGSGLKSGMFKKTPP
jgi:hypothetical protein